MKHQHATGEPGFRVRNIDIQSVARPEGYKHSYRNGRTKHGFVYTVSGMMCDTFLTADQRTIYARAGELVFIPKDSVYTGLYAEDNTRIKIVQFDIAEGELPSYLSEPVKIDLPNAGELIEEFFKAEKNHLSDHPFYYLSRLYELLWRIDESYSRIPTKYKKLQPALSEISQFYDKNEAVSYYAELCYMSEVNFRKLFKEYTGMSPIEYRNDLRLKNARAILQSGEYNVTEAADISGFSNLSFFIRLYKKRYGHTPKKE